MACLRNDAATVQRKLATRSLHDTRGVHGSMPLHAASRKGVAVMEILIARGANVHSTDDNGLTALYCAAFGNNGAGINLLLENGADASARTKWLGSTALDIACRGGSQDSANSLIQWGAHCTSFGHGVMTPLHHAAKCGHLAVVQLLTDAGSDVFAVNEYGESPEQIAAANQCPETAAFLQQIAARQEKYWAFAMGNQPRLGENSMVCQLDAGVVTMIGGLL